LRKGSRGAVIRQKKKLHRKKQKEPRKVWGGIVKMSIVARKPGKQEGNFPLERVKKKTGKVGKKRGQRPPGGGGVSPGEN